MSIAIYTDGGARGNPGPAASAFIAVAEWEGKGRIIRKYGEYIGKATNNQAEYRALIMALEWASSRGFRELDVHSDSELMVKQLRGEYRVRSPGLRKLHSRAMELLRGVKWRAFHHTRENDLISACDMMVNRVLDSRYRSK